MSIIFSVDVISYICNFFLFFFSYECHLIFKNKIRILQKLLQKKSSQMLNKKCLYFIKCLSGEDIYYNVFSWQILAYTK